MEITLEKKDQNTATIKVNLKESDYQPKVAEKLKEYSKKAVLKGFRPGKVPTSLIEKMYGKSILVDEINHLLSHSVTDYIKENKLAILGDPLPKDEKSDAIDWESQKEFEFNYDIGLVPDFKYELSDKVKMNKYQIDVEDKVVDETLENLRQQYGQMIHPEISEEGDFISGELKEKSGEFTTNTMIPLNKVEKGVIKTFKGLKVGDKVEFEIEKAFKEPAAIAHVTGLSKEEAEKKKGTFEFTVSKINRSEPANLDQEFFDKLFGKDVVKTEEEFRAKLKTTIKENYDRESDNLLQRDIQDYYVNSTEINLPDEFLKRWLLISNQGQITEEQIEKEFEFYAKELKWSLIKNKIAEDNNIKVENDEVINRTKEMIRQQFGGLGEGGEEMEETLKKIADNYLAQEKGKNYMKLYEQVFFEKVFSVIKDKVKINEKAVNVEEFKKAAKIQ